MSDWQVYRATLDGVQTVAVKELLEHSSYQQHKFANEISILRSCRNENIVCFLGRSVFGTGVRAALLRTVFAVSFTCALALHVA